MARLASREKALFYPTPVEIVDLIAEHIVVSGINSHYGRILDPCAGDGVAVGRLRDLLNARPRTLPRNSWEREYQRDSSWQAFGVELSDERAIQAKEILGDTNVICGAFEQIGLPPRSHLANILFLNPPYDQVGNKRVELRFLDMTLPFLEWNGILVYIIPCHLLTTPKWRTQLGEILRRSSMSHFVVRKFPEPFFDDFKQVVVFATKGGHTDLRVLDKWQEDLGQHEPIPTTQQHLWQLTSAGFTGTVHGPHLSVERMSLMKYFDILPAEPTFLSEKDWEDLSELTGSPDTGHLAFQPLRAMGQQHAAMVTIAGLFDGLPIQHNGTKYVIRGSTYKATTSQTEEIDKGTKTTTTERTVARLAMVNMSTGVTEIMDSEHQREEFEAFMLNHAHQLVQLTERQFPPITTDEMVAPERASIKKWARAPRELKGKENGLFPMQEEIAATLLYRWRKARGLVLDGEMSVGKTVISLIVAALQVVGRQPQNQNVLVLVPSRDDLLWKWKEEAETALRELNPTVFCIGTNTYNNGHTLTGVRRNNRRPMEELRTAFDHPGLTIILAKQNIIKDTSGWEGIPLKQRKRRRLVLRNSRKEPGEWSEKLYCKQVEDGIWSYYEEITQILCPFCHHVFDKDELDELPNWMNIKTVCPECGYDEDDNLTGKGHWWQDARDRYDYARTRVSKWIRNHYNNRYVLIIDEAHESKSLDTNISYAANDLVSGAWRHLQMTGTLLNGMSSSVFRILYRSSPQFRAAFGYGDVERFIATYGLRKFVERKVVDDTGSSYSGYKIYKRKPQEIPGISPAMACRVLPVTAFLSLDDLAHEMVSYSEHTLFVSPTQNIYRTVDGARVPWDQGKAVYTWLEQALAVALEELKMGNRSPLSQWAAAKLCGSNLPLGPDSVAGIQYIPPEVDSEHIFPKEEAFLRLMVDARQRDRKVICYVNQIHRRDPTTRLLALLTKYGLRGRVMQSSVSKRVAFLEQAVREDIDVVLCQPELVNVGLDLVMFNTVIWFNPNYNMYVVSQANRRIWRLQSEKDCEVYYLALQNLPEALAFHYIAQKMMAMQAVRGDIRAGLARILGDETLVQKLQDQVLEKVPDLDSDLVLDDLPELVVIQRKTVTSKPPTIIPTGAGQLDLFTGDGSGDWKYTVIAIKTRKGHEVQQYAFLQ